MSRFCPVSSRRLLFGNNVSHANNRTRRTFALNLQPFSFFSEVLGQVVYLRLSTRGMRSIEKAGGLDAYLEGHSKSALDEALRPLKRSYEKAKKRLGSSEKEAQKA